jgi:hypothetical protein
MSSAAEPKTKPDDQDSKKKEADNNGHAGTVPDNWWQSDGQQIWTENNGNTHDFEVNDTNW